MLKPELLPTLQTTANALALQHNGRVRLLFRKAFIGFSADLTDEQAILLARNPAVELVQENADMEMSARATDILASTEWAIDRIDQVNPYLDSTYTYCTTRDASLNDANPIFVYIFDGGVDRDHREFLYLDGQVHGPDPYRVAWTGFDFVFHSERGAIDPYYAPPGQYNCGGESFIHGTAVAGLIAGRYIGVDKQAGRTDTAATSYSAALVSGAAARYLEQNPTATPADVWNHLSYQAASLVTDDRSPNSRKPLAIYGRLLNVVPECP